MIQWIQERMDAPIPTWMAIVPVILIAVVGVIDHFIRHRHKRKPKRNPELVLVRDAYVTTLNHLYDIEAISWNTRDKQLRELASRGFDVKRHFSLHPEAVVQKISNVKAILKTRSKLPKGKPVNLPDAKLVIHS